MIEPERVCGNCVHWTLSYVYRGYCVAVLPMWVRVPDGEFQGESVSAYLDATECAAFRAKEGDDDVDR